MVDPLAPLPPPMLSGNEVGGPKKKSLLDGLITGLFGPSTAEMTQAEGTAEERERAGERREAGAAAAGFANDPAAAAKSFMKAPSPGGGSGNPVKLLGDIVKFFAKPGM